LWVDSAAAVQNTRDKQSHADHLTHKRMHFPRKTLSCFGIDSSELITVIHRKAMTGKLL